MHALLCFRLASFVLFALFGVLNIAFAAWNLAAVGPTSTRVQGADIYTLIFSAISLLAVGGMLIMEQVHIGSPRLWLELIWVGCFALLSLVSAATATTLMPVTACMTPATSDPQFCVSSNAVVATNWITTVIYLGWFITVVIYGITRSFSDRDVWFKGIKDVNLRPDTVQDATINEKIARLPAVYHRPEVRTSEYSVSTVKTEKDDISIAMPYNQRSGPIGVGAINGAPVYHPYGTTNAWDQRNAGQSRTVTPAPVSTRYFGPTDTPQAIEVPPRRPFIVALPHTMSTGGSSILSADAGSNPSSGFEWINTTYKNTATPSPAVIMQAHKQQPLYGAHIEGTEGHRRTRSNTDPTREGQWSSAPSRERPNQSSIILVNDRRPSEAGVGLSPQVSMGHARMLSTDSAFGVGTKKPKHRPPPLDLSRLSNIKQAEKR